ncbi:MAG TPA: alpha-xylosidase [Erysipelothrix sp.]|nr:alpha-xylosidase [Erysipelothrix sp.]
MKFSDGGWLMREGFDVNFAEHVYTSRVEGDKLVLFAPFRYIDHKGLSLDGGMLTLEFSSPINDVISVEMYHHKGFVDHGPHFEINKENNVDLKIEENEEYYIFQTGKTKATIYKGQPFIIEYTYDGVPLTSSHGRSKAHVTDPTGQTHISEQLNIGVGENIYGLGERFTPFIKNGQTVDIWNEDGGTGTEQAYKNIPFYISNNNYGLFVNSPDKVSFEVGSEKVSKVQFSVPSEKMHYYLIGSDSMKSVLEKYTDLTGKPGEPPAWSFGLWLSTSFLTDYDEETVTHFVDGMIERDIPLEVFHFDCLWMKEFEWCNFSWDECTFPDPKGMLKNLKDKGLKISVWINPYIAQKSPLFDEALEKGYLIKKANGDVWQWDKWQAGMGVVDFTNPKACAWYNNFLTELVDMGVDSFKTDFGERIPTDVVYHDGSNPHRMHNYYAYLYNEVVFEHLEKLKGKGEAVLFARSASVGSQKFPVHWGGDNTADYPSMAESLRAGLSFGMSGFGYWSHDIGGFESGCTPDLYKRWTQFGLLSSHSRYHGSWEYKVPWLYGEEAVDITREFTKLKLRLMPYLLAQSKIAYEKGIPMMRPLILEHQDDITAHGIDLQYYLGDSLMVAPIFNEEGRVNTYLPNTSNWTHFLDNRQYKGGQWVEEVYDYHSLPLMVPDNALIPVGYEDSQAEYDVFKDLEIHAFEVSHQTLDLIDLDKQEATINIELKGDAYHISLDGIESVNLIFRNKTQDDFETKGTMHDFGTSFKVQDGTIIKVK